MSLLTSLLAPGNATLPTVGSGDAQFPTTRTRQHLDSYIGFVNTAYTGDDGTRMYLMPDAAIGATGGTGGALKIFGDAYYSGTSDYRDFGLFFHSNLNSDNGYHGQGVFWLNSKVNGTYAGLNPDIAIAFEDGAQTAVRFTRLTNLSTTRAVTVVGGGDPDIAVATTAVKLEMQGDLGFNGSARGIRWYQSDGTTAGNLLRFNAGDMTLLLNSAQRFYVDSVGSVVCGTLAALGTTTTAGFVYAPSMAGTPTGTPTSYTGKVPIVLDTTGSKLWAYIGGAWKSVTLA